MNEEIKKYGSIIALAASIVGIGAIFYSIGRDSKSDIVDLLKHENTELKKSVESLSMELEAMKLKDVSNYSNTTSANVNPDDVSSEPPLEYNILKHSSVAVLGGAAEVTLKSVSTTQLPYKGSFSIFSQGGDPKIYKDLESGETINYKGYQILIVWVGPGYAKIRIYSNAE